MKTYEATEVVREGERTIEVYLNGKKLATYTAAGVGRGLYSAFLEMATKEGSRVFVATAAGQGFYAVGSLTEVSGASS